MQYTEGKIVREYNQARYKNKQIGILAQLNTCHRKDIIEILERNGVVIPDKYKHSHEEEYDYKAMVSKEKTPYKMQQEKKKADKPKEEPKEPEKDPEEELEEEVEEYLKATLPTPEIQIPEEVKEIKSDKPYYFIWLALTSLDRRITKLERKYKRLKKEYKQLAKIILG